MPAKKKSETAVDLYDGSAIQRIPFEVMEGSQKFTSAHNIKPTTDERSMESSDTVFAAFPDMTDVADADKPKLMEQFNIELQAIENGLWREQIIDIENVEYDAEKEDFRDLIDNSEIDTVMTALNGVNVVVAENATSGVRRLGSKDGVTVTTQALFSGKLLTQTHKLRRRTTELDKMHDQITWNRDLKPSEAMRAKGKLYDQISIETTGFKGKVPLRFKIRVVDHHFTTTIDAKKS